jgi:type I restriction enzyme S subunit
MKPTNAKLRFKNYGFPDWKSGLLGELVNEKSPKFNPEKSSENFIGCIELEHIEQNSGRLLGLSNAVNLKSIKNKFQKGDVLFGKMRPYLRKFLHPDFDGVCSTEIWVLKGKDLRNDYLYQLIQTDRFIKATNQSTGSKMPRADWGVVSKIKLLYPSQKEQEKIASFLTLIDQKINLLTQNHELLVTYKKGVTQKIFSQEIRFKDDAGNPFPDWEHAPLEELLTYHQPTAFLVDSTEYSDLYKTPVLTAGKTFILGYTNETSGIFTDDLPAIIFDDFTTAFKYVDFPFKAKSSAMKILVAKDDSVNLKYVFEAMSEIRFQMGNEHKRYWISEYSKLEISKPSEVEQTKIANFLSAIDEKISITQNQLDLTKQYKQGLLQQMFV